MMIANSKKLGCDDVLDGEDLVRGNPKVNALFVAEVFNTKNGLIYEGPDIDWDEEGTAEERAFRYWINSLGIEDCFVRNLYDDVRDGLIFLKVCDKIKPGSVNWDKVVKKQKMTNFDHQTNCDYAFEVTEKVIGKKQHGLGGGDIRRGHPKNVLALIWQLCRVHYLQILGNKQDRDVLQWANSVVPDMSITKFNDPVLKSGVFLLKVIDSIRSGIVDWSLVTKGEDEEDALENAKYAIGLARKMRIVIFCT